MGEHVLKVLAFYAVMIALAAFGGGVLVAWTLWG